MRGAKMGVYDKEGEIRLMATMLEAAQWELQDGVLIAAIIEIEGASQVLESIGKDTLVDMVGEVYEPEDLFTYEDLHEWARANIEFEDDPGYEERERY
jgi:hypothetical protein